MAIEIRELRPAELKEVLAFLGGQEGDGEGAQTAAGLTLMLASGAGLSLSVVARDDGQLAGAVLCVRDGESYRHRVLVAPSHRDTDLARRMLDKAFFKLLAAGVKLSHIRLPHEGEAGFWHSVLWQPTGDGVEPEAEAAPASARQLAA